jgi:hypothetical protein
MQPYRERVVVRRSVFGPQGDNIAASQLAIDGEVQHRQVAGSSGSKIRGIARSQKCP